MTDQEIEEELSVAYLTAVAALAGYSVDKPHRDNDSIDAVISAAGDFPGGVSSPRIEVQLKATINCKINDQDKISYPLPVKNYRNLSATSLVPRLLLLLCLPRDKSQWLSHTPSELVLRNCMYYFCLHGAPATKNEMTVTVYVPSTQMFTPQALQQLMNKAAQQSQDLNLSVDE